MGKCILERLKLLESRYKLANEALNISKNKFDITEYFHNFVADIVNNTKAFFYIVLFIDLNL